MAFIRGLVRAALLSLLAVGAVTVAWGAWTWVTVNAQRRRARG